MKALLVLSGGYDSLVVLKLCTMLGYNCHVLFFDYGQLSVENERKSIVDAVYKYSDVGFRLSDKLTQLKIPLNWALNYKETNYFPWRNLVLMSNALSFAEAGKFDMLVTGINASQLGYPDTTPEFLKMFENICAKSKIKLWNPLQELYKGDVFEFGTMMGIDINDSWYCDYSKSELPCGKCGSCQDVIRGIEEGYLPKGKINYPDALKEK